MKIVLCSLNAHYVHTSLAIRCLAAVTPVCHPVELCDYTINADLLDIADDIAARQPDLVGLSVYVWNREHTVKLAGMLRLMMPSLVIVAGGPEAGSDWRQFISQCPAVDFVCCGEGEEVWPVLLAALSQGKEPDHPAVIGRPARNGPVIPAVVADLATIPSPVAWQSDHRQRIVYYEGSRGCNFSCRFCLSGSGPGVRWRPLDGVKRDLAVLCRLRPRQIKFVDRTFNADGERARRLWQFLIDLAGDDRINFHFEIRAELLSEADFAVLTKARPGLFQMEIGLQSLHPPTQAAIGRIYDWQLARERIARLQQLGNIHLHLDLIIGLPEETMASLACGLEQVAALAADRVQLGFLKMLPATGMQDFRADVICSSQPPYQVLYTRWLDQQQMAELRALARVFDDVYNNCRLRVSLNCLAEFAREGLFGLFRRLAAHWRQQDWLMRFHSPDSVVSGLISWTEQFLPDRIDLVREILKFEIMTGLKQVGRPAGLDWDDRWRLAGEKEQLWRDGRAISRICPGYRFSSWRTARRMVALESFSQQASARLGFAARRDRAILAVDLTTGRHAWLW